MAKATIGELDYKVTADTRQFEKGMTLSRKELSQSKRVMRETETATERYGREVDELSRLHEAGAIDAKTYNRALEQSKRRLDDADKSTKRLDKSQRAMSVSLKRMAAALLAFDTARRGIRAIGDEFERIDRIAKASRRLGFDPDQLIAIQNAAAELSGLGDATVQMAMQRFARRLSEAAQGRGEALGALRDDLQLNVQALSRMGTFEALKQVADAMKDVRSEQDRLRIAFKLFDSEGAGLSLTLQEGAQALEEYRRAAIRTGEAFSEEEAAKIERANDAIGRFNRSLRSLATDAAVLVAPALEQIANQASRITESFETRTTPWWLSPGAFLYQQIMNRMEGPTLGGNRPGDRRLRRRRDLEPQVAEVEQQVAKVAESMEKVVFSEDAVLQKRTDYLEQLDGLNAATEKVIVSFDRLGGERGSIKEFEALFQIRTGHQERREQARRDQEAAWEAEQQRHFHNFIRRHLQEADQANRRGLNDVERAIKQQTGVG